MGAGKMIESGEERKEKASPQRRTISIYVFPVPLAYSMQQSASTLRRLAHPLTTLAHTC